MRTNKTFLFLLTILIFASVHLAEAQQAKKLPRIGYLSGASAERDQSLVAAFQQGLQELGYLAGKNILIEQRYAGGQSERPPELAAELVRLKVDVLVAIGILAAHAAKKATSTIPIIMNVADPVGSGLVASLARPGGNVTGVTDFHAGMVTKRLELLKEVVPVASRVAVLLNPANPSHLLQLKDIQASAPGLGLTVLSLEVRGPEDIGRAFATARKERAEGLVVLGDPMIGSQRKQIVDLAAKSRLPAIYTHSASVDAGGLMAYGTNFPELFRRMAIYVDRILKGAKPADLPVEQPTKFELVINLKTARALGVKIPAHLLMEAGKVIE